MMLVEKLAYRRKITSKGEKTQSGQVLIPHTLLEVLNVKIGDSISIEARGNELVITRCE
jgi:bifunctional DNA-binding transcriptional regulator/antitoxin component of YhaV-PrlF toxin-antitoxin module